MHLPERMLCFCCCCNSKFSTASACPRTDDPTFQYFKWHLTFPTCEMRKKKSYTQAGPTVGISYLMSFHGKQKRETETLAGTRQHKKERSADRLLLYLLMEVLSAAAVLNCLLQLSIFSRCGGEPAVSSAWPRDLRLTFTDNLAIVTITHSSRKHQRAADTRAEEQLHSCVSQFLPLSLPCVLACLLHSLCCLHLPFPSLSFPAVIFPLFSNLSSHISAVHFPSTLQFFALCILDSLHQPPISLSL